MPKRMKYHAKRVKVTFNTDHVHAGQSYADGDQETVTLAQARWLEQIGVIEPLGLNESEEEDMSHGE